jgi:hypothetical protein
MIRKDVLIAILATFCLTATLFIVLPTKSSQGSNEYDSWADINDDGKINMYDIGYTAQRYGAAGDPTKNVNVVNWPVANQQTVFSFQNESAMSKWYNASGFGHMHLVWYAWNLVDPESITLRIWARIETDGGYTPFVASSLVVTNANSEGVLSFPVPSELFRFDLFFAFGTEASARLAFYLTYA